MSKKLPLAIRRNYSIKDQGDHWVLKCDVCSEGWSLKKPEKGKDVHGGNILKLLDHAASHPLPTEEVEEVSVPSLSEPIIELAPESDPAPTSHEQLTVSPTAKYAYPTERHPNAYKVEVQSGITKVSHFRDPAYAKYRHVQQSNEGYFIVLYAANAKHASLIGQRFIERHIYGESS